jgi:hypothetical protein
MEQLYIDDQHYLNEFVVAAVAVVDEHLIIPQELLHLHLKIR